MTTEVTTEITTCPGALLAVDRKRCVAMQARCSRCGTWQPVVITPDGNTVVGVH